MFAIFILSFGRVYLSVYTYEITTSMGGKMVYFIVHTDTLVYFCEGLLYKPSIVRRTFVSVSMTTAYISKPLRDVLIILWLVWAGVVVGDENDMERRLWNWLAQHINIDCATQTRPASYYRIATAVFLCYYARKAVRVYHNQF